MLAFIKYFLGYFLLSVVLKYFFLSLGPNLAKSLAESAFTAILMAPAMIFMNKVMDKYMLPHAVKLTKKIVERSHKKNV
jgi:hypothetical protein